MLCHEAFNVHVQCLDCFPSFVRFDWVLGPFWANQGYGTPPAHTSFPPLDSSKMKVSKTFFCTVSPPETTIQPV